MALSGREAPGAVCVFDEVALVLVDKLLQLLLFLALDPACPFLVEDEVVGRDQLRGVLTLAVGVDEDLRWLVPELEDVVVMLPFVDGRELAGVALGLDGDAHLLAAVARRDVPRPALNRTGWIRLPDERDGTTCFLAEAEEIEVVLQLFWGQHFHLQRLAAAGRSE